MKKHIKGIFMSLIILIAFVFTACNLGFSESKTNSDTQAQQASNYERAFLKAEESLYAAWETLGSPSMLLVMENGEIIYEKGTGLIGQKDEQIWKGDNFTNIGSVSKLFVTAAILNMDQAKLVEIDSPVVEYLPEFKMKDERYKSITIRMLLNHSSGLPGMKYDDSFLYESNNERYFQDLLEDLTSETLKANPGEYPVYCNEGFILAQEIVKRISGMDYEEYINNEILAPMQIPAIYISANPAITDKFIPITDPAGNVYPREVIVEALSGTGGLSMDARTLALFGDKILSVNDSVLDADHIALFCENQAIYSVLKENAVFNGLGWDYIEYAFGDLPVYSKNGGTLNYVSQIIVAPESHLVVVAFATNPAPIGNVAEQLMTDMLVLKGDLKKLESAPRVLEATVPQTTLEKQGKYSIIGGALAFDVTISENQLVLPFVPLSKIGNESGQVPYTYMADGTFSSPQSNERYEKFSFETIDGNDFIMLHFHSNFANYKVVYAQKVDEQDSSYGWESLSGTLWLKEDINSNSMLGMQDMIVPLTVDPITTGFVTFVRQTPFRTVSESLAISVNETARDAGNLIIKDQNTLSFRGGNYIRSTSAKTFSLDTLSDITEKESGKTSWFFSDRDDEVDISSKYPEFRVVIFDENLSPIFDNISASKETVVKIPANSYIMVTGK